MIAPRRRRDIASMMATVTSTIRIRNDVSLPFQHADLLRQVQADAAGADDADDGRRARVGLEEIQHLAGEDRQHLRHDAEADRAPAGRRRWPATPSTGRRSAVSIASDISLAKAPKSAEAIASAPANGPSPTTLIQISAQISVSMLRMVSRPRRVSEMQQPVGDDVARGEEAERHRQHRRRQRAEKRDRQRLPQRVEIEQEPVPGAGRRRQHQRRRYRPAATARAKMRGGENSSANSPTT